MGLFSSKKDEVYVDEHKSDKSAAVRTLRSRFYGKSKPKRTADAPSSASTHSPPPSSFSSSPRLPAAKPLQTASPRVHSSHLASSAQSGRSDSSSAHHPAPARPITNNMARAATDAVTVTLAQRLSELAAANEEGLLNDDEYRVLRQSLFERFASSSSIPTEAPIVRMSGVEKTGSNGRVSLSSGARPASTRAPSVQSRNSVTSSVTDLFRRATGRKSSTSSADPSGGAGAPDTLSIYSQGSAAPSSYARTASRKTSNASLRSPESPSVANRFLSKRSRAPSTDDTPSTPSSSRRHPSLSEGPPSSYRGTHGAYRPPLGTMNNVLEEERSLDSVAAVRREIELVEAEARHLQDTFNGLELSTLTRRHRPPGGIPQRPRPGAPQRAESAPHDRVDTMSMHSDHSRGTSRSAPMTLASGSRIRSGVPLVSQPVTLSRKTSFSSLSSRGGGRREGSISGMPTAVAAARTSTHANSSMNSLNSPPPAPPLGLESVAEDGGVPLRVPTAAAASSVIDDEEYAAIESEMADIRRKRAEVTTRYEERLEYLRAKLKSAEMKERLLRK